MSKKKSIYLAGPMSGIPDFNFPAFNAAAAKFEAEGWEVFNPANKEGETLSEASKVNGDPMQAQKDGFDFRSGYTWDVNKVIEADAIYLLEGWQHSPGARGEYAVALAVQRHYPDYEVLSEVDGNAKYRKVT
jgi:Domain of unknown function (DUF4406)